MDRAMRGTDKCAQPARTGSPAAAWPRAGEPCHRNDAGHSRADSQAARHEDLDQARMPVQTSGRPGSVRGLFGYRRAIRYAVESLALVFAAAARAARRPAAGSSPALPRAVPVPELTTLDEAGLAALVEQPGSDVAAMSATGLPAAPEDPHEGFERHAPTGFSDALPLAEPGKLAPRCHGRARWRAARPADRHSAQRSD